MTNPKRILASKIACLAILCGGILLLLRGINDQSASNQLVGDNAPSASIYDSVGLAENPTTTQATSYGTPLHQQKPEGSAIRETSETLPINGLANIPESIIHFIDHECAEMKIDAIHSKLEFYKSSPSANILLLRLGKSLYANGRYSDSITIFEEAWKSALQQKPEHWSEHKLIAEIAANLGALYARLGRQQELKAVLAEMEKRPIEGSETLAFANLRQASESMEDFPEHSFKCGPLALGKVFSVLHPEKSEPARIAEIASPSVGFSVSQVVELGKEIGFPVKAVEPAAGIIPVPSVVHWKSDHYAAITAVNEGRYMVEDATFQRSVWMTPQAIQEEASGLYLVAQATADPSWPAPSPQRASSTFGKGAPSQSDADDQGGDPDDEPCPGLPRASFNNFYASLTVRDSPLFYSPPVGPEVSVDLTYFDSSNYDNSTAQHGHAGKKWILGWVQHVEVPQLNSAGATLRLVRSNGRTEKFQGVVAGGALTFAKPGLYTRSLLTPQGGAAGAPLTVLSRSLPDGSIETYGYFASAGNPQAFGAIVGGGVQSSKLYLASITDPQGNSLRFRYVPGTAKLKTVVDAIGQETTVFYSDSTDGLGADNPSRRLISAIQDPFGRIVRFRYDAQDRLTSLTDAAGLETTFAYAVPTTPDFISSMTTPYGTSSFVKDGTTLTLTDPEGLQQKVSFAFTRSTIPLAGVSGTSALAAEVPTTSGITVANGQAYFGYLYYGTTLYWDKKTMRMFGDQTDKAHQTRWAQQSSSFSVLTGVASSRRPALSHREWYHYADQPNVGTIGTSSLPTLRIRRIKDENGNPADEIHRYAYNAQGYPTRMVDPLGRETVMEYAANNIDLTAVRQKNGETFDTLTTLSGYGHDAPHRPRYSTDASGQTTELRWNARGQLLEIINPLGHRSVLTYDANGYLTKIENTNPDQPAALVTVATFGYDSVGRMSRITGSDGYFVDLEYDALNRPTKTTYPDGTWESVVYQALNVVSSRDRLGRITTYTHNGNMQPTSTTDPAGRTLRYEWCSCGALQVLVDAMNRRTRWHYDIAGRQTAKEYTDGSKILYGYDPASGRLSSITDEKGQIKTRRYHLDNTLAGLTYTNEEHETPDVTFTYETAYRRLATMLDGIGTISYAYHPIGTLGGGQLASIDTPLPDDTLLYSYDQLSRRIGYTINGVGESMALDALGRVQTVTNPLGSFGYTYHGATSRLDTITYPTGMTAAYTWHPLLKDFRLKDIIHTLPGNQLLSRHSYEHNAVGNITRWTQISPASGLNRSWQIGYDDADQLTSVASQDPTTLALQSTGQYAYTYDKAGNRLTETIDGVTTTGIHNALNQLVTLTKSDGSSALPPQTYEWDAENRLCAVNYTGTAKRSEFTYDGVGRRHQSIERDGASITSQTSFVWKGMRLGEERDTTVNTVDARYLSHGIMSVRSNLPAAPKIGGLFALYSAEDHLGSIRELVSSSNTLSSAIAYDPWGRHSVIGSGQRDSNAGYTGHWFHPQTETHWPANRQYAQNAGRWLSRDPISERGGLNLYEYSRNEPIHRFDPDGRESVHVGYQGKIGLGKYVTGSVGNVYDINNGPGNGRIGIRICVGAGLGGAAEASGFADYSQQSVAEGGSFSLDAGVDASAVAGFGFGGRGSIGLDSQCDKKNESSSSSDSPFSDLYDVSGGPRVGAGGSIGVSGQFCFTYGF